MPINPLALLENVILTRALFAAAQLNIAEHLAEQSLSLDELAVKTQSDSKSLSRLLYFLELHEVFSKEDEKYFLTSFSETMCENHPATLKPFLLHDDETRWNAFGNLGYSIATGKASFDMLYNCSYFDHLKKNPLLGKQFDNAMTIISQQEDTKIAQLVPCTGTVADIGGGKGQLINAIASQGAITQGILLDLPEVVNNLSSDELHPSCKAIAGSFFEPITLNANAFILKRILHDWDDQQSLHILNNVRNAMSKDSTLYIIDGILDQALNKKQLAAIDLALLTIFQGKERTLKEFTALIKQAQLKIDSITPLTDLVSVIACTIA